MAVIGGSHFIWNSAIESISLLLRSLRPVPEFVVIGGEVKVNVKGVEEEFGCSLQVFEDKMKAASTFNTLIDDDRRVILLSK